MSDDALAYPRLRQWVMATPWAILPAKLAVILDVLRYRAAGERFTPAEIQTQLAAATPARPGGRQGTIAVLPLVGVIAQRMGSLAESSGGISTERIAAGFRQAVNDPSISGVVFDIDSPGGAVYGVPELAAEIFAARGTKPMIAVANSVAASGAYWLGVAADELVVTPSGEVGSIGVITAHTDLSRAYDTAGETITLISAGKFKSEGNPFEPLGEEARQARQGRVDDYYGQFVTAVARYRGVSVGAVRNGYGEGRMLGAAAALREGMVDRIATLEETIQRLSAGHVRLADRQRALRLQLLGA